MAPATNNTHRPRTLQPDTLLWQSSAEREGAWIYSHLFTFRPALEWKCQGIGGLIIYPATQPIATNQTGNAPPAKMYCAQLFGCATNPLTEVELGLCHADENAHHYYDKYDACCFPTIAEAQHAAINALFGKTRASYMADEGTENSEFWFAPYADYAYGDALRHIYPNLAHGRDRTRHRALAEARWTDLRLCVGHPDDEEPEDPFAEWWIRICH